MSKTLGDKDMIFAHDEDFPTEISDARDAIDRRDLLFIQLLNANIIVNLSFIILYL